MSKSRIAVLAVLAALFAGPAAAITITVDSNGDTADTVAGNGTCGTGLPNTCTLRAAIQEANANGTTDVIDLAGLAGQTISVATALPDVTQPVTISGPANRVTVNGNDLASLFRFTGSAAGAYAISNLIVTNGRTSDALGGGGIYFAVTAAATITLTTVDVTSSAATAGPGGGIAINLAVNNSSASLSGVTVSSNTASADGGGLWARFTGSTGTMTVQNSSITGNTSSANGGGVAVKRGRLQIFESAISGNTATAAGGGVYLATETVSAGGNVRVENTTISGNDASTGGGAIAAASDNPSASSMIFTTVVANTSSAGAGGLKPQTTASTTFPGNLSNPFTSNIIAGNLSGGATSNCAAAFGHSDASNSGYNLSDDATCGFTDGVNHDHVVADNATATSLADVKLGALANNPVAPATRAILAGSAAIDAGNPGWDTGSDQRGGASQDGGADGTPGDSTPVRDIGAYEFGGFGLVDFVFASGTSQSVDEDSGPAVLAIKRYGVSTAITTAPVVAFSTSAGATSPATQGTCGSGGSDYTQPSPNPTNLAFTGTAGLNQFDQSIGVTICDDTVIESDETFGVALAKPAGGDTVGYDIGPKASGTVTIKDIENGVFKFAATTASAAEGNVGSSGSVTLTINRVSGTDRAVRVAYATTSSCSTTCTASAGTDYVAVASGTVDFASGDASKTITINFVGDSTFESGETFEVNLTGVTCLDATRSCKAALSSTAADLNTRVTITNDDTASPGALQFEFSSYTAQESTGSLVVKVKRVGGSDGQVTVSYDATDGSATKAPGPTQDYLLDPVNPHTLTWNSGDVADKTFTVTLVNDASTESNKTFSLSISSPTGCPDPAAPSNCATLGTPATAAVTLVSDEQPQFQFSPTSYSKSESGGSVTLNVSFPTFTGGNVTVPYYTVDGTAVSPTDYTGIPQGTPGTLTVAAGDSSPKTIVIPIINDSSIEGNETFGVQLGTPTGGATLTGTNPATVTIIDPPGARFAAATFTSASEQGGTDITVTVQRIGDTSQPLSVDYAISQDCANPPTAGCAEESVDYTVLSGFTGTLSWGGTGAPDQNATKTFTIRVLADTLIEGDESIKLDLSNAQSGTLPTTTPAALGTPSTATAVVKDDDYRFEIVDVSPLSVSEGAGNAVVSVRRFGSTVGAASVGYATADDTAIAGADYTATASPPTLAWANGEGGIKTISVPLTADTLDELEETFTLALSSPSNNASGEATSVTGSPLTVAIADDDAAPNVTLSLTGSPLAENGGTATVTATLDAASGQAVTVDLAFSGTAAAGTDYTASATSIVIPAGSTTGSVTLTGVDDALDEAAESIVVDVSAVTNGTESGTQQVIASITDDDATPTVALSLSGSPIAENGGSATVTATLSAASGRSVTVNLAYSGTAVSATDYTASGASIVIPAGSLTGTVTLTAINDSLDEQNETAIVDISTVSNATESGTQQVTASIVDDDAAPTVTLSSSASSMPETGGTASLTATLSAVSGQDVTVTLMFSGTATDGTDYSHASSAIVIPAGSLTGSLALAAITDTKHEAAETIVADIASVTNGTESGMQQQTVSITDDDRAPPSGGGGGAFDLLSLGVLLVPFGLRRRRRAA